MKKWISLLCAGVLAVSVLLSGCHGNGNSPGVETLTPSPVKDFEYTISGEGATAGATINKYIGPGGQVVVPNTIKDVPVIFIAHPAFNGNKTVTAVVIMEGIQIIEGEAFKNCTALTSMTLPNSLYRVSAGAFEGCTSLTEIRIPINTLFVGKNVFKSCTSLKSVRFEGDAPESFQETLFESTSPDLVLYYHEGAYGWTTPTWNGSKTRTWVSPYSNPPKRIINTAEIKYFVENSEAKVSTVNGDPIAKESIVIPAVIEGVPVTTFGTIAFLKCTALKSITLPDSLTTIEDNAFYGYPSLTSITIPDSVTSIGISLFAGCISLTSVQLPKGIKEIPSATFSGCNSLKSYRIPDSVTQIGRLAFASCTSLASITIPDSVTQIGGLAFSGCISLTSVTIPNGVTRIDEGAFSDCTSLTSITIPANVTFIGAKTFVGCKRLKEVKFEGNAPELEADNVFEGVSSDFKIVYHKGTTGWTSPPWDKYTTEIW